MNDPGLIVVALGGNAISLPEQQGNVDEQFENSRATARQLADLVEAGYRLVVTHGNGPQIGNFLIRNEAARDAIYPLPMEVAVAHVQGGMGFMIGQTLGNELRRRGRDQTVTTIVTTVLVDGDDAAFQTPTKPIGRVYIRDQLEHVPDRAHWTFKEIKPGHFRRVVPSPLPKRILEIRSIRRAVNDGEIVVACGGGGIPVIRDDQGDDRGTAAVIDKDLASALLAVELGADAILFLTGVDSVRLDFGGPTERVVERMTVSEATGWLGEGQFPPGSMGPKVQGAIDFLSADSRNHSIAIIGPLTRAADAMTGRVGTRIVRDE
ncbi:MAG: carbamate kinase [Phycisphaerales bacterium]|nr:carbamate kinase [Phycisphaerales bacterium]